MILRGLLIGAGSGLGLSVLLVAGVSLLVPLTDERAVDIRASATPDAPVMQSAADPAPTVPEALPPATSGPEAQAVDTRPAGVVPLPAGSQFNRPPEDGQPVTPDEDTQPVVATVGATARPGVESVSQAPSMDTATAALPQASLSVPGVTAPDAGDTPDVPRAISEGPPQTFRDIGTSTDVSADTEAVIETDSAVINNAGETAPTDIGPDVDLEQDVAAAPEAPLSPVTLVEAPIIIPPPPDADEPQVAPEVAATDVAPQADEPTIVPRRIVLDSERRADEPELALDSETGRPVEGGGDETEESAPQEDLGALIANAMPFDNPDDLPLFGIILIDDPTAGLSRDTLLSFQFPVTFAIDPTARDAAEAAELYRGAGHEVLILADALALQGGAQDVEVALAGALAEIPTAVGVLDRNGGGFASNRQALSALLPPMADAGLGFVTYGSGLNTGLATADRSGIPSAAIYRSLDDEGERATVITRYLDRATFTAAQEGSAIVVGRTSPETVTALYSWALGRRSDAVVVAPISHVLRRRAGG
ncbi:MAG: divergent polysaccharide deacetylase family protein [Jannaschia sp.]